MAKHQETKEVAFVLDLCGTCSNDPPSNGSQVQGCFFPMLCFFAS